MSMAIFAAMGSRLAALWAAADHDTGAFPGLAVRVLAETPELRDLDPDDLVDWALACPRLPPQLDVRSTFGEPPLTLYAGESFVIDAYFWLDGTTAIHQHGFSGAFHVLAGSSLHTRSRWTLAERVDPGFMLGELASEHAELLGRGDTRPIAAGDALIHALFHLDRPSCSLVVRTRSDAIGPQYTYLPPSVALDPRGEDVTAKRKRELLAMLRRCGRPDWRARTLRLLADCELPLAFRVLLDVALDGRGDAELGDLLAAARGRHGARVDALASALAEAVRQRALAGMRARVRAPEHRFFLALLLNLGDRAAIDALIERRHPGHAPQLLIRRWLAEIEAPFDVPIDATTLAILDDLLAGQSDAEILDRRAAAADPGAEELAEILARCHALRTSRLLGRLFR